MPDLNRVSLLASALVLLCACAGTSIVQRNVVPTDERPRKCIGSNDRNACTQYATQRCAGGFDVFEMDVPGDDGAVLRAYYYKCL